MMSNRIGEVEGLPPVLGTNPWDEHRRNIRKHMLESADWRGFKSWSTIIATMHSIDPRLRKEEEKYVANSRWASSLDRVPGDDATAVMQMYNLALYENVTGRNLSNGDFILEFGGGYGEMARVVYEKIRPFRYVVYDYPEVGILQRYYWDKCGIRGGPSCISTPEQVTGMLPDLFISVCGISEAPMPFKRQFLDLIWPSSILIQYQGDWGGNNNREIFTDWAEGRFRNMHHSTTMNYVKHRIIIAWDPK